MKYYSTLPATALAVFSLMSALIFFGVIPSGAVLLDRLQMDMSGGFYWLIGLIILLESIVYVGFYFPGQFFAVVLVISAQPTWQDILYLTCAMVLAATLGSFINYQLGRINSTRYDSAEPTKLRHLLLAMIHMNSLAFFMFAQGANHRPVRIVGLAGLLNLPYYLLLITATAVLSEEVMLLAENGWVVLSILLTWLLVSVVLDIRSHRSRRLA